MSDSFTYTEGFFDMIKEESNAVAIYPEAGTGSQLALAYVGLGLGEVGELQNKLKKLLRDGVLDKDAVSKELGDIFWYWNRCCIELRLDPVKVIFQNVEKLKDRKQRGVIQGSGDNR